MTTAYEVAERRWSAYPFEVRGILRLLVLLSVALLPVTSFAARSGTAVDLTSSAIEFEQGSLPSSGQQAPSTQVHRHCSLWAAEAEACQRPSNLLPMAMHLGRFGMDARRWKSAGPETPAPPPRM